MQQDYIHLQTRKTVLAETKAIGPFQPPEWKDTFNPPRLSFQKPMPGPVCVCVCVCAHVRVYTPTTMCMEA